MMLVKTYLDKSSIEGTGLFAKEFIPAGTKVWHLDDEDEMFSYDEVEKLPDNKKEEVLKYSYCWKGKYILCAGNGRFFNHSFTPNTETDGEYEIAKFDIQAGEEMTCNYFHINDDYSRPIFTHLKNNT